MTLSRKALASVGGIALASVSLVAIGYHAWRDFFSTESGAPAAPAPKLAPAVSLAGKKEGPPSLVPGQAIPAKPTTASTQPPRLDAPTFDVVRVEPTGESVVAGRAAPHAKVTLLDNGSPVAEAATDESGQFALLPTLKPGDHELSLSVAQGDHSAKSRQSVTVVVPKDKDGRLVVAVTAPDQPTRVLTDSAAAVAAAPKPAAAIQLDEAKPVGQVFIGSVEAGQSGEFFASGKAPAGAPLRLYLNNSPVATVTAGANGAWSLKVEKGLKPGAYDVRADQLDQKTGKVVARAAAPFDFRGFGDAKTAASPQPANGRAAAVVADLATVQVVRGDNLWRISRHVFGRGVRYTLIYEANANQIRDQNLIYPGQIFVVPKS